MPQSDPSAVQKRAILFIRLSAVLIALITVIVMWGWLTHNAFAVQLRPQYSSMKFNSAVSLFLAALAMLMAAGARRSLAAFFAALGLFLPLASLLEYASGVNFGIDDFFAQSFIETKVQYATRMAPNTAVALTISNIALAFYALSGKMRHWGEILLALSGSFVFALGIVPLIGYMGGIESAHTWGDFTGMALHTAICFTLIGISLVACAWKDSSNIPSWLAMPVAIGFVIVAISMWLAVKSYEDIRFEQSLQVEAEYIANRGGDRLTGFYASIDRIADRWIATNGIPRGPWEKDAQNYLKAFPFIKAIEWVDNSSHLQWIEPLEGNDPLIGTLLNSPGTRAETVQLAITTRQSQVTKAVAFQSGGKEFLYMSPLFIGDRLDGFIVAAFTLDDIFNRILMRDKGGPFYLTITEGTDIVYSNLPDGYTPKERWKKSAILKNKDSIWVVTVSPTKEILLKKNSPLPTLVLIIGLLTAVFATFSVILAFRSRRDAEILRASEDSLRQIIETTITVGAADFDLQSFMAQVVERMQILTPATGAAIELIEFDEIVYKAAGGSAASQIGMRMKRAGSLSGLCAEQNKMLISEDTSIDPRVNAEACLKVGARSMMVVPLVQRGVTIGVFKVLSNVAHAFRQQDIRTLQIMAGLLGGALGQELEIERRKKLEGQLRFLAQFDPLTGLPNRALFKDRLSQAVINNRRAQKKIAIFYMDLDHFKNINDKYGHAEGDALLKAFASRMTDLLRKGDTLARLGGDEFVLIAENLKDAVDAETIARKIIDAMEQAFELPTISIKVSTSIGVAVSAQTNVSADEILGRADEALYEAKRAGRNNFKIASL